MTVNTWKLLVNNLQAKLKVINVTTRTNFEILQDCVACCAMWHEKMLQRLKCHHSVASHKVSKTSAKGQQTLTWWHFLSYPGWWRGGV